MNCNQLLHDYEVDVEYPDVSGMEQLEMLLTRSELAHVEHCLTETQRQRVLTADKRLLEQAQPFYQSINQIASLAQWRAEENIPISHWWWYLDVIAQLSTQYELSFRPVATNGALSSAHNLPVGA